VTKCTFIGNSAGYGGGMFNYTESCPTLTNCIFRGNEAGTSGGGMNNSTDSDPILTNCIFTGNKAHTENGGGMMNYNYSDAMMINCTFSGNSAGSRGGGIYNLTYCYPTLTNGILWGNTAAGYAQTNGVNATYSNVQGGTGESWFGTGCIDAYPGCVNDRP
jgi:hypothetical protein